MQTKKFSRHKLRPQKEYEYSSEYKELLNKQLALKQPEAKIPGVLILMHTLPFRLQETPEGYYKVEMPRSSSQILGLISIDIPTIWVGRPDQKIPESRKQEACEAFAAANCVPVFLDEDTEKYGLTLYAKTRLWQLFHYNTLQIEEAGYKYTEKHQREWQAYRNMNLEFTKAAVNCYREDWVVWVHDYHLMMVPGFLRVHLPSVGIAYFQHTPFPSSEFYRMLPYRSELLKMVLNANLIGFNAYDYVRHFVNSCTNILGVVANSHGIDALSKGGCLLRVDTYPISIDPELFRNLMQKEEVKKEVQRLREAYAGKKIIVGIDKLDFPKGILHKLFAFEKFLQTNPEWKEKVVLLQFLGEARKRATVPEKQQLLQEINREISRINGLYGTLESFPIHHFCQTLELEELVALLGVSDVCLVTSLRDGMNLVSYEYVACQVENHGVLVVSEFTGAAQCLGMGAILTNPWNLKKTSENIKVALEMHPTERKNRFEDMYSYIQKHTAKDWASKFLKDLQISVESGVMHSKLPEPLPYTEFFQNYQSANKRLLVFGVVGVLADTPKKKLNPLQFQQTLTVNYQTKQQLKHLSSDPKNVILVIGKLDRETMDKLFGGLSVWLTAENGAFYKKANEGDWKELNENMDLSWKPGVLKVLQEYKERTPGSQILGEENSTYLSWIYGFGHYDFQSSQANMLIGDLYEGPLVNGNADLVVGEKSIEVRPKRTDAMNALEKLLKIWQEEFDFLFAMGKFHKKDEDIFRLLTGDVAPERLGTSAQATESVEGLVDQSKKKSRCWMCTVSRHFSLADYYVNDPKSLLSLFL